MSTYILAQLPGAILAEKFGGKIVVGLGTLLSAFITLFFAIIPKISDYQVLYDYLDVARALTGLCEGVTLPALNVMISKWAPPEERAKIAAFVYSGAAVGVYILTEFVYPMLEGYPVHPTLFYFYGGSGIAWFALWLIFCYDKPDDHPFVSDSEKVYLKRTLGEQADRKTSSVPWIRMLTSMPLWALIAVHIAHEWGLYTVLAYLPWYRFNVLGFRDNSSLHYVAMWACCLVVSCVADCIIGRKCLSITNVRKLGITFASILPGAFIILTTYSVTRNQVATLYIMSFSFLMGFGIPSINVNTLDLSPDHSGIVMAVCNVASVASTRFLRPYVVNSVLDIPRGELKDAFARIFWVAFGGLMAANLFYLIFGSGKNQNWNASKKVVNEKKEVETKREETIPEENENSGNLV